MTNRFSCTIPTGLAISSLTLLVGALSLPVSAAETGAKALNVLYSFTGGSDGGNPEGSLLLSGKDTLIGTTFVGGDAGCGNSGLGCGTVFAFKGKTEKILYSFKGGNDGLAPASGVIEDNAGNLVGTTVGGGSPYGDGTVFKLAPDGTESLIYAFQDRNDGEAPYGGVIEDGDGNFFGTASEGGAGGWGTVFEISAGGTFSVLHSFSQTDGGDPQGNLLLDGSGNLYGTTYLGGALNGGTVYKVSPNGTQTILHSFGGNPDGLRPTGALISDGAGNLYGTTGRGGSQDLGTVFEVSTSGTETVLYSFKGGAKDGSYPAPIILFDKKGNLYGTAIEDGKYNYGNIFKLTPKGTESVLYNFTGGKDGTNPYGIVADSKGHLYGNTEEGNGAGCFPDDGCGALYEIKE